MREIPFVVGRIEYKDGTFGTLVYIKSTLNKEHGFYDGWILGCKSEVFSSIDDRSILRSRPIRCISVPRIRYGAASDKKP